MKGKSMSELKKAIYTRLNLTWHSSIKDIPIISVNKTRVSSVDKEYNDYKELHHTKKKNLAINSLVYIKTNRIDKMDPLWEGPFRVIEIGPYNNWIRIQKNNFTTKLSIKNIRDGGRM